MSGRALIIVVTGIIMITSVILYNIGASSTKITANFNNYFLRQTAQNTAETGANLALRQLGNSPAWRTGFPLLSIFGGKVSVRVYDTTFASITNAIAIRSIGIAEYNSTLERRDTATVYCYFPPPISPSSKLELT